MSTRTLSPSRPNPFLLLLALLSTLLFSNAIGAPTEKRLLIITPKAFRQTLEPYAEFKRKYLPTELANLEDVLQSSSGVDDPERIKRYLFKTWKADDGLRYVLLVGDHDVFPMRYMVLDRLTPAAFDYSFYPSDLYYADLAKADGSFDDWNSRKDDFHAGYFGEVRGEKFKDDPINFDGVSYRPKVAVGRWPVGNEREAQTLVEKSMAYETAMRNGTHPGLRKAFIFHPGGWVDMRNRASRFTVSGWAVSDFFFQNDDPKFQTPPPDNEHLLNALNEGCELCVHIGHGSETAWEGSPDSGGPGRKQAVLNPAALKKLTNADRLPIIFSAGCSTAHFAPLGPYESYVDVDGNEHVGTDKGEVFTSPPPPPAPLQKNRIGAGLGKRVLTDGRTGAVAYIGCNTGSQPCGVTLVEGFVQALSKSPQPHLGDCWISAVDYYREREHLETLAPKPGDWYPPSIFFQGMKFMLFGDPSLPMAAPVTIPKAS